MDHKSMPGQIFVAHADLTAIAADAVAFSTSTQHLRGGNMAGAFKQAFGFDVRQLATKLNHIGDTAWIPLNPETKPYGIVAAVCTGISDEELTVEQMRSLPVHRAIACAFHQLQNQGITHRLLIALPLMRLGMGGDSRDPLGSARNQVAAARKSLDELELSAEWQQGADAVFVAYTRDHYQVFLEARRMEEQKPVLLTQLPPNFDILIRSLRNGECVLFVGAGLSAGTGVKSYKELIQRIAERLGGDFDSSETDQSVYLDRAQWFREQFPGEMGNLIAEFFGPQNTVYRPSLAHYLLLSMSFHYVLTTNYDDLLERTLHAMRRYPVKVVSNKEIAKTGRRDGTFVVKMHGDAHECRARNDAEDGIVISRDDYDQFFNNKPTMASLLEGLLLNQTFLFVGYSLRDPNFRHIHAKIAHSLQEAKQPAFTVVFENLPVAARTQWANKQVFAICVAGQDDADKAVHFMCLLDHIAEEVAGDTQVFLSRKPDGGSAADVSSLEQKLREVGKQLVADSSNNLTAEHARRLARTLVFLTDQGWRSDSGSLSTLWKRLAKATDNPQEKQNWLIRALSHGETAEVIRDLHDQLDGNKKLLDTQ